MKYSIERTDKANALISKLILFIAEKFGNEVALDKLDELEKDIMVLADNPYIGEKPIYPLLRKKGYLVLYLKKDIVFYKVDDNRKVVTIYAVVDQRQDYISIIRGM